MGWRKPLDWNAKAAAEGVRRQVFCASLADVFEDRSDLTPIRSELFGLIRRTPSLDWLLLTKRPENIFRMLPTDWGQGWENVWLGTSTEDQARYDARVPHLLAVPARIRFISAEPLLDELHTFHGPEEGLDWVVVVGESGDGFRPMKLEWARQIRAECKLTGAAFFYKQAAGPIQGTGKLLDGQLYQAWPAAVRN